MNFLSKSLSPRKVSIIYFSLLIIGCIFHQIESAVANVSYLEESLIEEELNMLSTPIKKFKHKLSKYDSKLLETLNPPATDSEIDEAENIMGLKLPDKVRELYKTHNGQSEGGLFAGLTFLSLEEAIVEWQNWESLVNENYTALDNDIISVPPHYIKEVYANKSYFPIGTDHSGNNLMIDLAPANKGILGQVINAGAEEDIRYVIANDIDSFLKLLTQQIEIDNIIVNKQSWHLKNSESDHFFESLDVLPLSIHSEKIYQDEQIEFVTWRNSLSLAWQNELDGSDNSITNWAKLRNIRRFSIVNEDIDDISPLAKMLGLREVILSASDVKDISALKALPNIKTLYLSGTKVTSVSNILSISSLSILNLNSTSIKSLENLNTLGKLKSLSIEDTLVKDLEEVGKITTLTELNVSKNNFDSFKPLNKLNNLIELNISETNFSDLSNISNLQNLQSLYMNDTLIKDYNALNSLKNLKNIQCTFDEFLEIKKVLNKKVRFTMVTSGLTEAQRNIWDEYRDS